MYRFMVYFLCVCLLLLSNNFAYSAIPNCPTVSPSDPCQTAWTSDSYAISVVINNVPTSCNITVYYCYRYCGSDLEIVYRGFTGDQSCLIGVDLNNTLIISQIKNKIWKRILDVDPPSGGIPDCGGTNPVYLNVKFGLANCYRMSAMNSNLLFEACDMDYITCSAFYGLCKDATTGEIYSVLYTTVIDGTECSEITVNWTVPTGNFIRPCMRFCDFTE